MAVHFPAESLFWEFVALEIKGAQAAGCNTVIRSTKSPNSSKKTPFFLPFPQQKQNKPVKWIWEVFSGLTMGYGVKCRQELLVLCAVMGKERQESRDTFPTQKCHRDPRCVRVTQIRNRGYTFANSYRIYCIYSSNTHTRLAASPQGDKTHGITAP